MMQAPRARKVNHAIERHGEVMQDPYAWLKDPNWQEVLKDPTKLLPDIRTYLDEENAYTKACMVDTEALQAKLFKELKGRIKEDDASVPLPDGPFEYFQRYQPGQQYPEHLRRPRGGGAESVILDVPSLAKGHEFCKVIDVQHSPDHRLLAYLVDFNGSERYELHVRDLHSGKDLPDLITEVAGDFVWCNDSKTLIYLVLDANHRPRWVKRHRLGASVTAAETLYTEPNEGFFLRLGRTSSRKYVTLRASDHTCSEVHLFDADQPSGAFRLVEARAPNVLYDLTHNGDKFYVELHAGSERDGCIVTAPISAPGRANWRPFLPYQAGRLIQRVIMLKDHLIRHEMVDALPRIVVRELASGEEHAVSFDEAAYHLDLIAGFEFATRTVRFTYSSMATPERTFDYDVVSHSRQLLKEQEIPSGHNPNDYEVMRLNCVARDGAVVPITILRHRLRCAPGAPLLLQGYGSYGLSRPASFSTQRISLVDRGIAVGIAHIRGGKEKGYAWYEDAKLMNKKRTFEDFIDCSEFLAQEGITQRGCIIAHGGSAGGMLMGAIANMAPDLFLGIVAEVPFVDVLNTMWDIDLPLTPPEWPEWGNPIKSKEAHDYIKSYSPYDNVERKDYPNILVLAGLTDPRVTYWEPAKWVARLRELKTGNNLLLMEVNMGAGHAGASGRFDSLHKVALVYAFTLKIAGLLKA